MSDSGAKKSVLITGATDGLGKAAALLLAQRGYRVFAAGRSSEKRAQLDAMAREKKLPLESIALEVCDDNSVEEAVRAYTVGSAIAEFQENEKGTITPGKLADIVMLSRDIFKIDPKEIEKVKIVLTIMDGRVVYENRVR